MTCTLERYNENTGMRECNCARCAARYNGWTNYETWLLNVHDWIDAETVQKKAERMMREAITATVERGSFQATGILNQIAYDLGAEAADTFDGMAGQMLDALEAAGFSDGTRRMMTDVLENFRGVVNWTELAGEHVEAVRYRLHWNGLEENNAKA